MKYKVESLQSSTYQVLERNYEGNNWRSSYPPLTTVNYIPIERWNIVFQGTLSECEAYIRLKENGYM